VCRYVVGTDTELLTTPVVVKKLDINTAERYQVGRVDAS
jgi:hypothetical protein